MAPAKLSASGAVGSPLAAPLSEDSVEAQPSSRLHFSRSVTLVR